MDSPNRENYYSAVMLTEYPLYKKYGLPVSGVKTCAWTLDWIIDLYYACRKLYPYPNGTVLQHIEDHIQIMAFIYNDTDLREYVQSLHALLDHRVNGSIDQFVFVDNIATLLKEKR